MIESRPHREPSGPLSFVRRPHHRHPDRATARPTRHFAPAPPPKTEITRNETHPSGDRRGRDARDEIGAVSVGSVGARARSRRDQRMKGRMWAVRCGVSSDRSAFGAISFPSACAEVALISSLSPPDPADTTPTARQPRRGRGVEEMRSGWFRWGRVRAGRYWRGRGVRDEVGAVSTGSGCGRDEIKLIVAGAWPHTGAFGVDRSPFAHAKLSPNLILRAPKA